MLSKLSFGVGCEYLAKSEHDKGADKVSAMGAPR